MLDSGSRLGPYEILSPLGAGGMGEVYKARDTKLDRLVAVKVLPESLANDREALARFEREAKAVAALSHGNILAIHDFVVHEGVAFAVMELLEGETIRELVSGGPLPVRKTIDYARQVCSGLAAAHAKGIVHRDLKPDNLFVTHDGRVKILDFGLAKSSARAASTDGQTHSPTVSAYTEPGTVMGTVGYMSPEQVKGLAVDHRSDLFSLGAVLYEMLTGRRAFQRETAAETMTAILREEPAEIEISGTSVSPLLDRIVRHCLEKKPEQRFQSATDIAFDLENFSGAAAGMSSGKTAAVTPNGGRRLAVAGAVVVAAIAAGALLDRTARPRGASPSFQRLTFRRGAVGAARFAADGRTVVYSAKWEGAPSEIFSVSSAGEESRSVGITDAMLLSVSPGDDLAVKLHPTLWASHLQGTLARVPLSGGSPRELRENVQDADWNADGKTLAVAGILSGSHWRIEYPAGRLLREEVTSINAFRLSPDGDRVALAEGQYPWWRPALAVIDRSGTRKELSGEEVSGLAWSRSGKELWFTAEEPGGATNLRAIDLSGKSRLVLRSAGSMALQDLSRAGDVLVNLVQRQSGVVFRGPGDSREANLAWHDGTQVVDISPDGKSILINDTLPGGRAIDAFYLRRTDGSPAIRLGEGTANVFSPDGKWVLAEPKGSTKTLVMVPTGAGETRTIPVPIDLSQWWFFPDGRRILASGIVPNGRTRLFSVDLEGGSYRQVAPDDVDTFLGEMPISPDGKLVAAQDGVEHGLSLRLYPADGGPSRRVAGFETDDVVVRWADDGHSLFVFKRNQLPARVFRLDVDTGRRTPWLELMPADPAGVTRIPIVVMTPDGRSYAYVLPRELSDLYRIGGLE
jgi:tRNA A-37 threonylcarbamoyl transferase component Bud32/Tol biopolymer transport system component